MVRIKYTELFEVDVLHDYYNSGRSADFIFQPTEACVHLLRRYNLIYKARETGFSIYSEVNTREEGIKMKVPFSNMEKFTFLMKLKNPNFVNFSELPLTPALNAFYYFNNLTNNIAGDGDLLLGSTNSLKSVSETDLIKKIGRFYSYDYSSDQLELAGALKSLDFNQSLQVQERGKEGHFSFKLDTIPLPEGRGEFWIDGAKQEDFYLAHTSFKEDFFAIVEVFYKDGLSSDYRFMEPDGSIQAKSYKIKFKSRATTWRYILNKRNGSELSDLVVEKNSEPAIAFTKDAFSTAEKVVFFSSVPQKFSEEPVTGIRLIDNESEGDPLIANLPNPSAHLIKKEGDKIFTDILIMV